MLITADRQREKKILGFLPDVGRTKAGCPQEDLRVLFFFTVV
jgi:hypothetical protein